MRVAGTVDCISQSGQESGSAVPAGTECVGVWEGWDRMEGFGAGVVRPPQWVPVCSGLVASCWAVVKLGEFQVV